MSQNSSTFEINIFLNFLLDDGRIRTRTNKLRIGIQEAQKNTDPEHRKVRRIRANPYQNNCWEWEIHKV